MQTKFENVIVDYKTINGMKVDIPATKQADGTYAYNVDTLIQAFAKAFVEYMTKSAIVSDNVLFSSIGASACREVMKLGFNSRCNDETVKKIFNDVMDRDENWKMHVLTARYGKKKGMIKFWKLTGVSDDRIKRLIELIDF